MKKILSIFLVIAFALVGGLVFTACGNAKTGEGVYNLIKTQMELMLEEGTPFATQTKNGVTSNYMLNNFNKKISSDVIVDYGWQDELIAIGLNYIEKYYPLAKDYALYYNVALLELSIQQMNQGFQTLKDEYKSTTQISQYEDATIYNGFMARYGEEARKFSSLVYTCALELSSYLSNVVKVDEHVGNNQSTQVAYEFYIDSRLLEIYNDYNNLLMINCKGSIGSLPATIIAMQSMKIAEDATVQQVVKIKGYFDALEAERKLTQIALANFSYYDYVRLYNSEVSAYQKVKTLAQSYYKQIERYYYMPSYLSSSLNYMAQTYEFATNYIFV